MLFSIITVCYNAREVIEDTILSVVNQNFDQIEYIIIDGGSTDGSLEIIRKYKDKIDIFVSEDDQGIYDAMNKGLRLANGQFVNFLNAGDSFVSNTILADIAYQINKNKAQIISGDFILVNDFNKKQRIIHTKKITLKNLKKDFHACHQSIFINRKITQDYDTSYEIKADYKWVISALSNTTENSVYKFNEPIVYYSKEGFSNQYFLKNLKELIRLHYEFFGAFQVIKNIHIYIYRLSRSIKDFLKN